MSLGEQDPVDATAVAIAASSEDEATLILIAAPSFGQEPTIRFANAAFCSLTGSRLQDVVGKRLADIYQDPLNAAELAQLQAAMIADLPYSADLTGRTGEGRSGTVTIDVRPMERADGKRRCWLLVQRQTAAAAKDVVETLSGETASLADYADIIPGWLWQCDSDYRLVYLSKPPPMQNAAVHGAPIWDCWGAVDNDDEARAFEAALRRRHNLKELRLRVRQDNGQFTHLAIDATPLTDEDGRFLGYRGASIDITKQVEIEDTQRWNEQRFRDFAETASDWYWEMDADLRFTHVSERYDEITGTPGGRLLGRTVEEAYSQPICDQPNEWRQTIEDLKQRRPIRRFELFSVRPDGRPSFRSISGNPFYDRQGRFAGYRGTGRDITKRKLTEAALRESERKFRNLAEGSIQGIVVHRNYKPLFANEALAKMVGYDLADYLAVDSILDLVPKDFRPAVSDVTTARVRGDDVPSVHEWPTLRSDGSVFWIEVRTQVVEWEGQPALLSTIIDIDDRKRAEAALRNSEADLAQTQAIAQLGNWHWDIVNDSLHWSGEVFHILGQDPHTLKLETGQFTELVHPADRSRLSDAHLRALQGEAVDLKLRILQPNGTVRWVHILAKASFDVDGQPLRISGTIHDVTEQQKAQQALRQRETQLRLITDSLPVGISYVDHEGRHRFANAVFEQWFQRPATEIVGQTVQEVFGTANLKFTHHVAAALAGNTAHFEDSCRFPDGKTRDIGATYIPHRNEDGATIGFFSLIEDVSERKRAEREKRRRHAELAHADRLNVMGEMAAAMAHDVTQPLSAVANYADGCLRRMRAGDLSTDDLREVMGYIHENAKRASSIVRHIGDFTRKSEEHRKIADVRDLVRRAAELAEGDVARADVTLNVILDDVPLYSHVVPIQIEQVVLNLIMNAAEATREIMCGRKTVEVRAKRQGDKRITIEVEDTGPGIPGDMLEQVFEPFYTTKPDGTGMGLSIVKTLVEAHGGQVRARHAGSKGALFDIDLPARQDA